jgi:hypothetical protein
MAFDFTADDAVLYNTDEFAVTATLTANGVVSTPSVIFDEAYAPNNMEGGTVLNTEPSCLIKASAYPTYSRGDTIVINGTTYKIHSRQPEPGGLDYRLMLGVD